jgi:hypothetical protein
MILTHPNNRRWLEVPAPGEKVPLVSAIPLWGMPIRFDETIPERDVRPFWRPPEGSRFVGYGPEDEGWLRPLGFGRVEMVDCGPLFFEVSL